MRGVPLTVGNDDERTIQSRLSTEWGDRDQGMPVRGGQGQQDRGGNYANQGTAGVPQGSIMATLQAMAGRNDTATIERELDWQGRVEGDAAKCTAFKDQCLSKSTFRAFAFMKGKLPVVHMAHSIGQFFGMSGLALDVQGKQIGFIGDRMNGRCPVPFILPPVNTWAWQKTRCDNTTARFTTHYKSGENADKLWAPGVGEGELGIIEAPLP